MPYPLNNVTSPTAYSEAATMAKTPPSPTLSVVITGAAVYYQFSATVGLRDSDQFGPETFVPPGRYYFDESDLPPGTDGFSKIRFRSALAAAPAQVSAS